MDIAITSAGIVTAHGAGLSTLANALRAGQTGVKKATRFPVEGMCTELSAESPVETHGDRALGLLSLAADEALKGRTLEPSARRAALLGTTKGMLDEVLSGKTHDGISPLVAWLARRTQARGPARSMSAACASSSAAIGAACDLLESEHCDEVVVAGVEALHAFVFRGFHALKAMSPRPAAPFDANRAGLSMGEGAGVVVLETFARAKARGAPVLARIVGHGSATDAHDQTAPHPTGQGLFLACSAALERAGLRPSEIGRYHAHGTATAHNDAMESKVCERLFGPRGIPLTAIKGSLGHTLGAAGVLDLLGCIQSLTVREMWPVVGLEAVDPALSVAAVREIKANPNPYAMVSTAGFGGINTSLVVRAP